MNKIILNDIEAGNKLKKGIEIVYNAVAHTLGPLGSNTAFSVGHSTPIVTNDGVSIAKEIKVSDKGVNIGIELLTQAAIKTNNVAGDGTTTTIVLAKEMYEKGSEFIKKGANRISLRKGMKLALEDIKEKIKEISDNVGTNDEILDVAKISSGNEEFGRVILKSFVDVDKKGLVVIEKGIDNKTYSETTNGLCVDFNIDKEMFSAMKLSKINKYCILNTNLDITSMKQIHKLLNYSYEKELPVLLIGNSISSELKNDLLINAQRGIKVLFVEPTFFGKGREIDCINIEKIIGAKYISKLDNIALEDLTTEEILSYTSVVDEVIINNGIVIFKNNDDNLFKARIKELKDEKVDDKKIQRLEGGLSTIYAGGKTSLEVNENYYRIEDAVNAVYSALEEGIVIGGGNILYRISDDIDEFIDDNQDIIDGYYAVVDSLKAPLLKICENSGATFGKTEIELLTSLTLNTENRHTGFNVLSGKVENIKETGIIDPTKTLLSALDSSVSIVSTILTTNCIIVNEETKKSYKDFL